MAFLVELAEGKLGGSAAPGWGWVKRVGSQPNVPACMAPCLGPGTGLARWLLAEAACHRAAAWLMGAPGLSCQPAQLLTRLLLPYSCVPPIPPALPAAGGLPAAWLSKSKTFRKLSYLSLAGNQLGLSQAGNVLDKAQWCQSEDDAGLSPGSGWCPQGAHMGGAMGSLQTLNLGSNSFTGERTRMGLAAPRCRLLEASQPALL